MLQRRNVTKDVKHFEECEQFFLLVGKCYAVEALLNFFNMSAVNDPPRKNNPPYRFMSAEDQKKAYWNEMLDTFINEHLITPGLISVEGNIRQDDESNESADLVREYSLLLLKYYFLGNCCSLFFQNFKFAVKHTNWQQGTQNGNIRKYQLKIPGNIRNQ